jgi:hypothetical protein
VLQVVAQLDHRASSWRGNTLHDATARSQRVMQNRARRS